MILNTILSGSANYNIMIICPCSMGTLGRISSGISNDLTTIASDVILKERRKLIVVQETPLSLIHLNNMKKITESGGIILVTPLLLNTIRFRRISLNCNR